MPQAIETPVPQPLGKAGELTHLSRGFNAFLTASLGRGKLSRINRFIISQAVI